MPVAKPSLSSLEEYIPGLVAEILDDLASIGILYDCAWRYRNLNIVSCSAIASGTSAAMPVLSILDTPQLEAGKCPEICIHDKYDIAALASVSTIRTALGNELLASERNTACSTVAGGDIYVCFI